MTTKPKQEKECQFCNKELTGFYNEHPVCSEHMELMINAQDEDYI